MSTPALQFIESVKQSYLSGQRGDEGGLVGSLLKKMFDALSVAQQQEISIDLERHIRSKGIFCGDSLILHVEDGDCIDDVYRKVRLMFMEQLLTEDDAVVAAWSRSN